MDNQNNANTEQITDSKEEPVVTEEQMVIFELDNEDYAVSILDVREIVEVPQITPVPESPEFILGVINLRGKIVSVLDIEKLFSLERANTVSSQHIMITEPEKGTLLGIKVDKVTEVLKIDPNNIQPPPKLLTAKISTNHLKGVLVIKEEDKERIIMILDLPRILSQDELEKIQKDTKDL